MDNALKGLAADLAQLRDSLNRLQLCLLDVAADLRMKHPIAAAELLDLLRRIGDGQAKP